MRHIIISAALAWSLFSAGAAFAQPWADSNEMQVAAGFFHLQDSDDGSVNADLTYGRYLSDPHWQLGILQGLDWNIVDDEEDVWRASTLPFVAYHFGDFQERRAHRTSDGRVEEHRVHEGSRVVPFIGGFVGGIYNDDDGTGTAGPLAGVKAFLDDNVFVTLKYRYEWYWDEQAFADTDDADGSHVANVGLGYLW